MIAIAPEDARQFLAEEIRVAANIRSPRIVEALATIPRERFLPARRINPGEVGRRALRL